MKTRIEQTGGQIVVCYESDFTPMLRWAQEAREQDATGGAEYKHVGTLPRARIEDYCIRNGVSFDEFMADDIHTIRLMEDPDFSKLRVWQGRI